MNYVKDTGANIGPVSPRAILEMMEKANVHIPRGATVCDFGAGFGHMLYYLADCFPGIQSLIALDPFLDEIGAIIENGKINLETIVQRLKKEKNYRHEGMFSDQFDGVRYKVAKQILTLLEEKGLDSRVTGVGSSQDIEDGSVDVMFVNCFYRCTGEKHLLFAECLQKLKPDGCLVLTEATTWDEESNKKVFGDDVVYHGEDNYGERDDEVPRSIIVLRPHNIRKALDFFAQ